MTDLTADDRLFLSHIEDAFEISRMRDIPKYVGFLDERHKAIVARYTKNKNPDTYRFWGGYEGAKRVFFCALSSHTPLDDRSHFPITPLTFTFRKSDTLSHRDFLGSLMALNIKRETIGDIFVDEGIAVVFLANAVAPMILSDVKKIGRVGVQITQGLPEVLPIKEDFEEISGTVSSLRLDCLIGLITGLSREKSAALIESKKVSLNHFECESVSKLVKEGDILSVRGYGRFVLSIVGDLTRKGRTKVMILKYK